MIQVIYVGILGYYLPLTIMLVAYCRIFYVMKKRMSQINHNRAESRPLANGPLVTDETSSCCMFGEGKMQT